MTVGRNDNDNDFSNYQPLLARFGIDYQRLNAIEDIEKKQKLKKLFDDLNFLILHDASTYTLMNWVDVFFADEELDAEMFFYRAHQTANKAAKFADSTMTMVYFGLNALGFILSFLAIPAIGVDTAPVSVDPASTSIASGWNLIDACGGIALGIKQIYQGEVGMGLANLAGSLQLAGCTIAADLGKFYSTAVHITNASMSALLGFSFAACMFISGALEFYEVYKAQKRIETLEKNYEVFSDDRLLQIIKIEKAQRANHLRSAKSWMACGVAMTIVAAVALSTVTCGALPALTAICTGAALLTGCIRKWWVNRIDYVAALKPPVKKEKNSCLKFFDSLLQKKRTQQPKAAPLLGQSHSPKPR
jgi:hypothetical protein